MGGSDKKHVEAEELFRKYMYIMCDRESDKTYRLKSSSGEGIMRNYRIAGGIELVYSEFESYYPMAKEEVKSTDYIEIMYMADGHAEFELENRRVVCADKFDICIFNSRIGVKNCTFGKEGMRSVSIVLLPDAVKKELNTFFETTDFIGKPLFKHVLESDTAITFPANELFKNIFTELMGLPEKYGDYHRKLLVLRAVISLLDVKDGKNADYHYFSGDAANRVHAARKMLGENLAGDISIADLSEAVGINRTTLQRVFKQMYGITIFEYRTRARMQEARNLLLEDKQSVTDIAGICGYSNASKFTAAYKKCFGFTPSEWRKINR